MSVKERGGVGESARRVDGEPKVTGEYAYGSDLRTENMLWGATVRAPHASACILAIHTEPVRHMDGVVCVLTAADLEHAKTFGLEFCDQPVLAEDVVRYRGEAVAVVAAETYEQARLAAASLVVDYEPLPAVTDMEQALRPDAPRVHHFGNVLRHVHIDHGDPANAFADVWVEGYYETAMQDQAALGPEGGLAVPAADGGIDLYAVTQWIHIDRQQIAPCLGLPEEKVRITLAGVGGAFGSREDITMQIHACLLALRTNRAVKMVYGREDPSTGTCTAIRRARGSASAPRATESSSPARRDCCSTEARRVVVAGGRRQRRDVRRRPVRDGAWRPPRKRCGRVRPSRSDHGVAQESRQSMNRSDRRRKTDWEPPRC